jgi:hypothetical protein
VCEGELSWKTEFIIPKQTWLLSDRPFENMEWKIGQVCAETDLKGAERAGARSGS